MIKELIDGFLLLLLLIFLLFAVLLFVKLSLLPILAANFRQIVSLVELFLFLTRFQNA